MTNLHEMNDNQPDLEKGERQDGGGERHGREFREIMAMPQPPGNDGYSHQQ